MRVQILSDQEVQVFLTHLDTCPPRDNLMLRLMLQCGLRAGEVSSLNIENVWRGGYVHPAVHLPRPSTKGKIARYIDMPEPLRVVVTEYIKRLFKHAPGTAQNDPLFTSYKRNNRLGVRDIERITGLISAHAMGRQIHPHVLRHTYATILMRYTNIRVVQQLLGHAKLDTTQIYTHPSSEDCKNAVNQAFNR